MQSRGAAARSGLVLLDNTYVVIILVRVIVIMIIVILVIVIVIVIIIVITMCGLAVPLRGPAVRRYLYSI